MPRLPVFLLLVGFALCGLVARGADPLSSPKPSSATAATAAAQVDLLINSHLQESGITPPGRCSDEDFLRRVSLDLTGRIPTPDEITLFALAPDNSKRAETIDRLLESPEFAATWAAYWREVVFSRATDARSRIVQPLFEQWLSEQVQAGEGWDRIATELLTATGNTREDGSTALIFAHAGDPAEIAAEVSRLFLGIQIQCANCHDHPYDQWKRADFHELAAFFPRIRLRRDGDTQPATFHIESADDQRDRRAGAGDPNLFFLFLDRDRDDRLTKSEAQRNPQFRQRFDRLIEVADKNGDAAISREEFAQVPRPQPQPGQGTAEYYTPDLENPAEPGTRTEPVFFVNDRSLPLGTRDLDRRTALAESLTAADNPWFARAFVNRVWAELIGEGFSTPVDDMGPERTARLPEALDLLAEGFAANSYDIRWVYRTVALTDAYQRAAPSGKDGGELPPYASASPTRLRGDQLYNALTQVVGGRGSGDEPRRRAGTGARGRQGRDFGRFAFAQLFNFDPSMPQADLTGNVPQALFMMNSPVVAAGISARNNSGLGQILERFEDDDAALAEIYLRVLGREPTDEESAICHDHIARVADRPQSYEDILWSLLNSTEFLTRR